MSRILERIKSEQDARIDKEAETLNPLDPNVVRCQKGLHTFNRLNHTQCPKCRKTSIAKSNTGVNLPPDKLYKKLWRVFCRDAGVLEDHTKAGKKLSPGQAKQLLEYLKFLQEAKALDELEQMENQDGRETKPQHNSKAKESNDTATDDGEPT